MKPALLLLLALTLLFSSTGFAEEVIGRHPIAIKIDAMVEKAKSTADMIQAYDQGIALWDAELNRVYQALRKALPAPAGEKLKAAQQEWILYRDASYAMLNEQYNQYEGTMYLPMRTAARMRLTEDRARYLTLLLETQQEHGGP